MAVMKFTFKENDSIRHQKVIKEGNVKQIYSLILTNEGISRAAIAEKTGLSRSTVSFLVDELVQAGIVSVLGAENSGYCGRKPIMLKINPDISQIAAISLKRKSFSYALFGLGCNEIEGFSEEIVYRKGCGKKIWGSIVRKSPGLRQNTLLAVCVSIPAQINNADQSIYLSMLDIADNCNLFAELKSMQPDIPLVVGNRASAYTYAEYKYACGEEVRDMIFVSLHEGINAGILLNERVFSAEIGHMSINSKGHFCECGKRGCLELYVSRDAILKRFNAVNYAAVKKQLEEGGRDAVKTARSIAGEVALGIDNMICMFSPRRIVFGGGIEELGPVFLKMVVNSIKIPDLKGSNTENRIQINYSRLGSRADTRGIVRYFLDQIFTIAIEMENTIYIWN